MDAVTGEEVLKTVKLNPIEEEIVRRQFEIALGKIFPEDSLKKNPFELLPNTLNYWRMDVQLAWISWKLAMGYSL